MATTNLGAVGISAGGVYDSETVYKKYKVVSANGGSYMYINPTPAAGVPLTDTSHWQQIATVGGQDLVDAAVAARDAAQGYKDAAANSAAQLAAGTASPVDTYANLTALNTDDPDNSKIYLTLDDGNWCYHNGSEFVAGGIYQAISTDAENVLFSDTGSGLLDANAGDALERIGAMFNVLNRFDKTTVTAGKYVDYTTGNLLTGGSYSASDWISLKPSTTYHYAGFSPDYRAFFDSNKTYISSGIMSGTTFTTPAGTAYGRFSVPTATDIDTVYLSDVAVTEYHPYKSIIIKQEYTDRAFGTQFDQRIGSVEIGELSPRDLLCDLNLFDKTAITAGKYINESSGALMSSASYSASALIPLVAGMEYYASGPHATSAAAYDAHGLYVSAITITDGAFTAPVGAVFGRFSIHKDDDIDRVVLSDLPIVGRYAYGTKCVRPSYVDESFKRYIPPVSGFLPAEICVAVGRTIEIYSKQVCLQADAYCVEWTCDIGTKLKRKWTYTGIAGDIGNHALTFRVMTTDFLHELYSGTTTVKVAAATSAAMDICPIGDSLTNLKVWMPELTALSSGGIAFVGTISGDVTYDGVTTTLHIEGRSGCTAIAYTTLATIGGLPNPFWNPATSAFDWAYYKTTYSIDPDAVIIWLGANALNSDATIATNATIAMIDAIRASDATIPVYVVNTPHFGDSYISEYLNTVQTNLMSALDTAIIAKSYTGVHIVPLAVCFDSENNYTVTSVEANPRTDITEPYIADNVHPGVSGYQQAADVIYSAISAHTV